MVMFMYYSLTIHRIALFSDTVGIQVFVTGHFDHECLSCGHVESHRHNAPQPAREYATFECGPLPAGTRKTKAVIIIAIWV